MDTGVKLSRAVMAAIGRELRAMYADIIAEGVPEEFAETLRRLDESSGDKAERETSLHRNNLVKRYTGIIDSSVSASLL